MSLPQIARPLAHVLPISPRTYRHRHAELHLALERLLVREVPRGLTVCTASGPGSF